MYENIPLTLRHIMEVYRLIRELKYSRLRAIKEVAQKRRVDPQTITSACTRSIGINTYELEDFLTPQKAKSFCLHLVKRFPSFQKEIESFFDGLEGSQGSPSEDPTGFVRTLFPEEQKNILKTLLLKNIYKKISKWLGRGDLPSDLRCEMEEVKKQINNT